MHLRYALLALLSEGEAHGYQLLKLFNQRLGPFWHPTRSVRATDCSEGCGFIGLYCLPASSW